MAESLGIGTLERQVIEAALIATRPTSSAHDRHYASNVISACCWESYINIIGVSFTAPGLSDHSSSSSNASAPNQSRQTSSISNSSAETGNIVENIAYATSPSKQQPLTSNLEQQIKREADGAKLLLMTLFCNKIRRDYSRLISDHAQLARHVFEQLVNALLCLGNVDSNLQQGQDWRSLLGSCCNAVAAVAVRTSTQQSPTEGITNLIISCRASITASLGVMPTNNAINMPLFSPQVALRLLADVPGEVQSANGTTTTDIASDAVMETLQLAMNGYITQGGGQQDHLLCLTLNALTKWAEACKDVTLSSLGASSFLSQLVALLSLQSQLQRQWSTAKQAEDAIIKSSRALSACIDNTSDYGAQSRKAAVASLLASIASPTEFLVAPLKTAGTHLWEDATVALSNLTSTLAREEIDEISTCRLPGCFNLIELLLELQAHPIHDVAVPVLEVWLALQDVPTSDRHPNLAAPLHMQLVEIILNRVAYTPTFVSWEEELDLESSDFDEMRRLCADNLIGAYCMLRSAYLETLSNIVMSIDSQDWEIIESALWCICAVGREACARVKSMQNAVSSGRDSPVAADGEATVAGLTEVVGSICAGGAAGVSTRHPLVLSGIASFLGSYSIVWAMSCPPQFIIEILAYLSSAVLISAATEAAGKSIRLVLIASAGKLTRAVLSPGTDISVVLSRCMEAALSTNNAKVMASVAEGCSRVSVQLRDKSKTRATLLAVAAPTISRARSALDVIISSSSIQGNGQAAGQVDAASKALVSYLGVIREVIRFCDSSSPKVGEIHVLSDVLAAAWPVLNGISSNPSCRANEAILGGLLDVHSQLLSAVPALIGQSFKDLVTFVVKAYEESFCPSALAYVSAAVEIFDTEESIGVAAGLDENGRELLFNQILAHLCQCTFTYVTQTKRPNDCPDLITALFEMAQRYLLFSPGALCHCPEIPSLFALAVACLTECKGEAKSTRAALNFLTQLIGWKHLHLQKAKMTKLMQCSGTLDNLLTQHGEAIAVASLGGLAGGAPQILWPSYSECLFSIVLHITSTTPPGNEPNTLLCTWLRSAMTSIMTNTQNITPEIGNSVIQILCDFANEGINAKQKAKMALMDFGKIAKGESPADILLAYSMA